MLYVGLGYFLTFLWFCVNLGGNLLFHYLTNYLIFNTLVN